VNVDSLLQTHAEVAVALAGFASVAAVLRRPLSPQDRQRFLSILFCALIQVLGSLVPVWLSSLGVGGPNLWRVATAFVLILSLSLVVLVYLQLKILGGVSAVLINVPVTLISRVLSAFSLGALAVNFLGVPVTPGFGLYYTSLLLGLTVVFIMFADAVVSADDENS
jgi:hypothetical protein